MQLMSNPAVPVLDFAQRGEPAWLAALDHACQDWGCFQLGNHGLDSQLCQAVLTAMQQFFALSVSEKRSLERTEDNPWGFYDRELTKNVPDWKQIFDVGLTSAADTFHGASTPWPALSGFRETMEAYFAASHELALMLLADIGECLGAERGTLEREFGDMDDNLVEEEDDGDDYTPSEYDSDDEDDSDDDF